MAEEHEIEEEIKFISMTRYLRSLPKPKGSVVAAMLLSVFAGFIGYSIVNGSSGPAASVANGALAGLLFIAFPALASAYIKSMVSRFMRSEIILQRSMAIALLNTFIVSVMFLIACSMHVAFGKQYFYEMMIFSYILVLSTQGFIIAITHPYTMAQTVMISFIHPILGIIFLRPLRNSILMNLAFVEPYAILLKFVAGSALFLLGMRFFIKLINAPMRRNFGVGAIELGKLFIGHWYDDSSAIEDVLKRMGVKAKTWIGIIGFRAKGKLKALLITPYLHPGPIGEIGGSKLTRVFRDIIEKESGAKLLVAHGTVTFDHNPLTTDSLHRSCEGILRGLPEIKYSRKGTPMVREMGENTKMSGQLFGDTVFMTSTMSPKQTEDIDFAVGVAAMNEVKQTFANAIYADCHNCYINAGDYSIYSATPHFFDILETSRKMARALKKERPSQMKMGYAEDMMGNYGNEDGIGPLGLRVMVIESGGRKNAYIIFDANNSVCDLRLKVIGAVKKLGIGEVELMTSDAHCVNNLRGIENPLGDRIDREDLVNHVVAAARRALEDLEPVEVGGKTITVDDIDVFGPQRAAEIVTTIDATIATLKIGGGIIFISSLLLAFIVQFSIPW